MWAGLGALFSLLLLVVKLWSEWVASKKAAHNAKVDEISQAVASGDTARISRAIMQLRR